MNIYSENSILTEAIQRFGGITGAGARQLPPLNEKMDAVLQINMGKVKHSFFVEIKNELRETNVSRIIEQVGKDKEAWLLVVNYIPQPVKKQLKGMGINYLETSGNCFIHTGTLFIFINDQPVTPARQTTAGKLWRPSGLRFLFAILADPGLINAPYRKMAEDAGIALGNIGNLLDELKRAGYVKDEGNELVMTNKEQMINRWVEQFHITLRPRLVKGRFRFLQTGMEREWQSATPGHFYWGGEPAGAILTGFFRPETFTIYSTGSAGEIMKELKIVPDPAGNIEWLQQFWGDTLTAEGTSDAVPPLLAYSELMAGSDSRNNEVAARIKMQYLQ